MIEMYQNGELGEMIEKASPINTHTHRMDAYLQESKSEQRQSNNPKRDRDDADENQK